MFRLPARISSLVAVIFIPILIYYVWFLHPSSIFSWGDWGFYYPESVKEFFKSPQLWMPAGMGVVDISLPLYPIAKLLYTSLAILVGDALTVKLVYIYPSVILPSLSMYLYLQHKVKSQLAIVIASLFFSLNPYFLVLRTGHFTLLMSYALGPLILLCFESMLRKPKTSLIVLTGLLSSLSIAYEVRGFFLTSLLFIPLILFRKRYMSDFVTLTRYAFIMLGLNVYWLIGLYISGGNQNIQILGRRIIENAFSVTSSMVFALNPLDLFPIQNWIFPVLGFIGFYISRNKKMSIYFAVIGLFGIFLGKVTGQPFGDIYKFLYNHVPGFSAFREPSKFMYITSFSFAYLISMFYEQTLVSQKKLIKYLVVVAGIVAILFNLKPWTNDRFGYLYQPRVIPQDYEVLRSFLLKQNDYFRVVYVSRDSRWGTWTWNHPKVSLGELANSQWSRINNFTEIGNKNTEYNQVTHLMNNPQFVNLLAASSIKYVIVPNVDSYNQDYFLHTFPEHDKYINNLSQLKGLTRINIGTSVLAIFELKDTLPKFYSQKSNIPIPYVLNSESEYLVDLSGVNEDMVFTSNYQKNWQLLSDSGESISPHNTDFSTMLFPITDKNIKKAKLIFKPQSTLDVASLFSGLFLVFLLLHLLRNRSNE